MRDTIACPGCGIWIECKTASGTSFECRDCELLRERIKEMESMVERLVSENEALKKEATRAAIMRSMIGGLLKEEE